MTDAGLLEDEDDILSGMDTDDDLSLLPIAVAGPAPTPRCLDELHSEADYVRAAPELQEQFDGTFRFCPCCSQKTRRGTVCEVCERGNCHYATRYHNYDGSKSTDNLSAAILPNGHVTYLCPMVPSTAWTRSLERSSLHARNGRTYLITHWKLALIDQFHHARNETHRRYYTGVRIDFRRMRLFGDPNVDAFPEYYAGATVGLRNILQVARVRYDTAPLPSAPRAVKRPEPPTWFTQSEHFVLEFNAIGQDVYVEYEPLERSNTTVLEPDYHEGQGFDLACAKVGDRLHTAFGPRVTAVKQGLRKRKGHIENAKDALKRIALRGRRWTEVTFTIDAVDSFDQEALAAAVDAKFDDPFYCDREMTIARALARYLKPNGILSLAKAVADMSAGDFTEMTIDEGERYQRGYESLDSALFSIITHVVQCPQCGVYESGHRGPIPCEKPRRPRLAGQDTKPPLAPAVLDGQLALF